MKKKLLKAARGKWSITYRETAIWIIEDFLSQTVEHRRKWHIFQVLKEINCQSRILYPVKLPFIKEGKIKTFSKRVKLRESISSRSTLKELPKEVLWTEGKWYQRKIWNFKDEGWATEIVNIWVNRISFPLSSIKWFLKAKIITLSDGISNVCRCNMYDNCSIKSGGQKNEYGGQVSTLYLKW